MNGIMLGLEGRQANALQLAAGQRANYDVDNEQKKLAGGTHRSKWVILSMVEMSSVAQLHDWAAQIGFCYFYLKSFLIFKQFCLLFCLFCHGAHWLII